MSKRKAISLDEKRKIMDLIASKTSQVEVAAHFGLTKYTVNTIWANRQKLHVNQDSTFKDDAKEATGACTTLMRYLGSVDLPNFDELLICMNKVESAVFNAAVAKKTQKRVTYYFTPL